MENKLYKKAGVSLDAGYETVELIKPFARRTFNKGVVSDIGSFGALFDIGKFNYKNPILVSSTDGVGTKLLLVIDADRGHFSIGQDLVAMCVNDIVALGAKPLFFLDYIATGKLEPQNVAKVINGMCTALESIECSLIGGETAEMPGMYSKGHYDLAGFTVGIVEKDKVIDGVKNIKANDVIIALPSSGIHSNGFSLVRKIFFEDNNFSYVEKPPYAFKTLIAELLTPTKLYVNQVLGLIQKVDVQGIANITGGGIYENIPRILPKDLTFKIDFDKVKVHEIFKWMQELSKATNEEMYSTFNMGIGMVIVVNPKDVDKAINILKENNEDAYIIGKVVPK